MQHLRLDEEDELAFDFHEDQGEASQSAFGEGLRRWAGISKDTVIDGESDDEAAQWYADDEDQGDTLRASELNSTTLAQLASFSSKGKFGNQNQLGPLQITNQLHGQMTEGDLTHLEDSHPHFAFQDDDDPSSWDEAIEFPDELSSLSLKKKLTLRYDEEVPSLGSTSDATTDSQTTKDVVPCQGGHASSASSAASDSGNSSTKGTSLMNGNMLFDPIKLRWVPVDGKEEADPFEEEISADSLASTTLAPPAPSTPGSRKKESDPQLRRVNSERLSFHTKTHRRISNKGRSQPPEVDCDGDRFRNENQEGFIAFEDVSRLIEETLRSKPISHSVPAALKSHIPETLWRACFTAKARHDRDMVALVPRPGAGSPATHQTLSFYQRRSDSTSCQPNRSYLYLLRSMAQQVGDEPL